ncbi:MAG TPA: helix-turn-helix domain-containing protein [Kribbella sp.]|uniref:helix-turn-helix domain-containing protein n=1 Tax=Kribbella sp. TaxID=1871183 RepID=UPI002D76EE25|nr:helix-turn-helix domain-containing protein [Kribbella sp.]HET6298392.1 helix-turn-helix domain-containing protein [Kribbella sp.]
MKGLLLRLNSLDSTAESAVRVIGFFDALVTSKADLGTLLQSTATLAECPVGIDAAARGLVLRADPAGGVELGGPPAGAGLREYGDAVFWLAREGAALPLDEMVLERFALAGSILLDRTVSSLPAVGDPALVELVVADSTGIVERSRALHLLGLSPTASLRVAAFAGTPDLGAAGITRTAIIGDVSAALLPDSTGSDTVLVEGTLMGLGPELPGAQAAESWRAARTALRFASHELPVIPADQLGGLVVLAERLRPEDIASSPDVAALDRIAAEPGGDDLLSILRAYCATDSVRKAAALVYRHHSTVAYRLEHAEAVLGFELGNPAGRLRLSLAMVMLALRPQ